MRYVCVCRQNNWREARRRHSGLPAFTRQPMTKVTRDYIVHYDEIARTKTNWLAYMGRTGVGKSTQAFMIVEALLNRQNPPFVRVYFYPEIVRELSALRYDSYQYEETLERILRPELIVFDDFLDVTPKAESFEEQVVLTLIKRRYQQRKPLIITTEKTPPMIMQHMPQHGEAIFGRIFEMCAKRLQIASATAVNHRFGSQNTGK